MFRLLSYPLTENAPVWPGNPPAARTEVFTSIARGELANMIVALSDTVAKVLLNPDLRQNHLPGK